VAELSEYEVPHRSGTMTVKLSEDDAELLYGDRAKKRGDAKQGEVQAVRRAPYAEPVPAAGESDPSTGDTNLVTSEKKAPAPRNKGRA
jgi:hypothetical protein